MKLSCKGKLYVVALAVSPISPRADGQLVDHVNHYDTPVHAWHTRLGRSNTEILPTYENYVDQRFSSTFTSIDFGALQTALLPTQWMPCCLLRNPLRTCLVVLNGFVETVQEHGFICLDGAFFCNVNSHFPAEQVT